MLKTWIRTPKIANPIANHNVNNKRRWTVMWQFPALDRARCPFALAFAVRKPFLLVLRGGSDFLLKQPLKPASSYFSSPSPSPSVPVTTEKLNTDNTKDTSSSSSSSSSSTAASTSDSPQYPLLTLDPSPSKKAPPNWQRVYSAIAEMRKLKDAPVDSVGCASLADRTASPKVSVLFLVLFPPRLLMFCW
jgi:hypothetical protein